MSRKEHISTNKSTDKSIGKSTDKSQKNRGAQPDGQLRVKGKASVKGAGASKQQGALKQQAAPAQRSASVKQASSAKQVASQKQAAPAQRTAPTSQAPSPRQEYSKGAKGSGERRNAASAKGTRGGAVASKQYGTFAKTAEDVSVGDKIIVTIKRIGINGEGVGYYKRKAVFIQGALVDEVVKAKVSRVESGYLNAELIEVEKSSPHRQKPPCPVYEACGGCQLQHMSYNAQLAAKEEIVRESFRRYAGLEQLPMRPIIGMDEPWHYRNKAQLQTGRSNGEIIAGLYAAGSHQLVDITGCAVQHPAVNDTIEQVKRLMGELDIPIYNERTREGTVRTIVARVARATDEIQLTIITATDKLPDARRFVNAIRQSLPKVKSIAHNVNRGKTPLIFGERTTMLWGAERLEERLGKVEFSLSPRAFFQLNPEQTIKLYNSVQEAAALEGSELVVDAYCGTGTIGLWLAPYAGEVRGIEVIPEAVRDARDNARTSGIENALFYEGRAEQLLPEWVAQGFRPDVIVVDPPRTGCEPSLLKAVAEARPKRFVYVSCNPSTLAKDCKTLLASGYLLEWVQPVDMFPQTSHIENVCLLVCD